MLAFQVEMAGLHATNQLPTEAESVSFAPGDKIEARFGGGAEYYPGTIGFVHTDAKLCDIMYDDGDGESGVPFALIRKKEVPKKNEPAPNDPGSSFTIGTEVEVRGFKGGWRPGTITVVREEGSFDVALADGTTEKGVPPTLVRLKEEGESKAADQPATSSTAASANTSAETGSVDAEVAAALQLPATTRKERELKEELSLLVKAQERQQRTVEKNNKNIQSLKTKIAELEVTFGAAGTG